MLTIRRAARPRFGELQRKSSVCPFNAVRDAGCRCDNGSLHSRSPRRLARSTRGITRMRRTPARSGRGLTVKALVLSAGGMFGAYQAGAWKALAGRFKPDLVIGASVGSLNAWAIAGGASPEALVESWLSPECKALARVRVQLPWRGCFDSRPLHAQIQRLWAAYRPRTSVAVVATELPALRPRAFQNEAITWRHLAASCAVLLGYEQVRIGGRLYTDGGLLGTLPLWAAREMGATDVIGVDVLPYMPSLAVRAFVRGLRALAPAIPQKGALSPRVTIIAPREPLGPLRKAVFWSRQDAARWIARGEADARCLSLE